MCGNPWQSDRGVAAHSTPEVYWGYKFSRDQFGNEEGWQAYTFTFGWAVPGKEGDSYKGVFVGWENKVYTALTIPRGHGCATGLFSVDSGDSSISVDELILH